MRISAVVAVRDSEGAIAESYRRLSAVLAEIAEGDYEIVFVNDGSRDHSFAALEALAWTDARVVAIDLSRSFGENNAISCGLANACGDIVVTSSADLRHPPEEIPSLVSALEARELDVVYGVDGADRGVFRDWGRAAVELAYRKALGNDVRVSSFRAMRKEIADSLLSRGESCELLDGMIAWLTSRIGEVAVSPAKDSRARGRLSLLGSLSLAAEIATTFSLRPLWLSSLLGALLAGFGFSAGLFFVAKKLLFGIPVTGYASLIVSICVFAGAQLLTAGIVAAYLGRVHANTSGRPGYAIRKISRSRGDVASP